MLLQKMTRSICHDWYSAPATICGHTRKPTCANVTAANGDSRADGLCSPVVEDEHDVNHGFEMSTQSSDFFGI